MDKFIPLFNLIITHIIPWLDIKNVFSDELIRLTLPLMFVTGEAARNS